MNFDVPLDLNSNKMLVRNCFRHLMMKFDTYINSPAVNCFANVDLLLFSALGYRTLRQKWALEWMWCPMLKYLKECKNIIDATVRSLQTAIAVFGVGIAGILKAMFHEGCFFVPRAQTRFFICIHSRRSAIGSLKQLARSHIAIIIAIGNGSGMFELQKTHSVLMLSERCNLVNRQYPIARIDRRIIWLVPVPLNWQHHENSRIFATKKTLFNLQPSLVWLASQHWLRATGALCLK